MKVSSFHFGDWRVEPDTACLIRGDQCEQLEPRAMDVLVTLCHEAGQVLSTDELLLRCWAGLVVGENQVHKAITQLRRALGDSASEATYIETIRKRGYRAVAPVALVPGGTSVANANAWAAGSPYVGLESFDTSHAAVFFGRDAAIGQLHHAVLAQARGGRAFVLVLGPSGSGKTSLVQAGLLPALSRTGGDMQALAATVLDLGDISDSPLMTALGGALLDLEIDSKPLLANVSAESIGIDLQHAPNVIAAALRQIKTQQANARAVLFVDRLEVLFAANTVDDAQRQAFLTALDTLARSDAVIVIAACRNDFYPHISQHSVLMEGKHSGTHFDVAPPTRAEIALMIRQPAAAAGLSFGIDPTTQARLDDLLCEGAANSADALPLLQYTLQELYLQRTTTGQLTIAAYHALGGIEGAIGRRAELTLHDLPEDSKATLPRILSMLITQGSNDEAVGSHRAPWSALRSDAEHTLVRTLVEHRLFVSLIVDREPVFGIAHEALLRQWPRVTDWLAAHRHALRVRSRLAALTAQWCADGRPADRLLPRGKPLDEARELLDQTLLPISDDVKALITASIQRVKRGDQFRLGVLVSFAFLTVLAILLGLRANRAEAAALQRRQEAEDLMGYMVGDFADKLRPLGRLDLLDDVDAKALQYLQSESTDRTSPTASLQHAKTLQTIAEVERARGNPDKAMQALATAQTLLQINLKSNPRNADLLKNLGGVAFWMGDIQLDQGKLDGAEGYFRQYLEFSQRMSALDPADVDAWVEISYAQNSLGSIALARGDEREAVADFQASLNFKTNALTHRPTDKTLRAELADTLSWLAEAKAALGELNQAIAMSQQQTAELQALHQASPSDSKWVYRQILSIRSTATLLQAAGRNAEALALLDTAQGMAASILKLEPSNHLWQRAELSIALMQAGITAQQGNAATVLPHLQKIADDIAAQAKQDPKNTHWLKLEIAGEKQIAEILMHNQQGAEAAGHINVALTRYKSAMSTAPTAPAEKAEGANMLLALADIQRANGDLTGMAQSCHQALAWLGEKAPNSTDYHVLAPWVLAQLGLGERARARDQIARLEQMGYRDTEYLQHLSTLERK